MQITVFKDEMSFFERYANRNFELTQLDKDNLCAFSTRVAKLNKTEKFNQALVKLKSTFENEFKDGCYGISCTNCALKDDRNHCNFREFRSFILDTV